MNFNNVGFYKPLVALAQEQGVNTDDLFNVSDVHCYQAPPTFEERLQVWEQVLQRTSELSGDPAIGLRFGQHVSITSLGTLGFALMSCTDLEEVLRLVIRYHPILNPLVSCELFDTPHTTVLRVVTDAHTSHQRRTIIEATFSTIVALGEFLLNQPLFDIQLQLNFPAPKYRDSYQQVFSMPVAFEQEHCQLVVVKNSLLNAKLKTANPSGCIIFKQQCELMLRKLNTREDVASKVRSLLMHASGHFPDINQVACELAMSERTLRRRLKEENTSFRRVFDEVRNVLACEYLSSTQIIVAEISNLLGYSECVNFRRAFVRWNKITPNQYRIEKHNSKTVVS